VGAGDAAAGFPGGAVVVQICAQRVLPDAAPDIARVITRIFPAGTQVRVPAGWNTAHWATGD
jgi:hypothetical protein